MYDVWLCVDSGVWLEFELEPKRTLRPIAALTAFQLDSIHHVCSILQHIFQHSISFSRFLTILNFSFLHVVAYALSTLSVGIRNRIALNRSLKQNKKQFEIYFQKSHNSKVIFFSLYIFSIFMYTQYMLTHVTCRQKDGHRW